tara:strand:+ start:57 stop:332 length:276 start_codon:yes stop_codon:yes gene_type:complete
MGSPHQVSKVNKEKANKIARKWMNRTQKGMRIDDFIAKEVMGQGFTGLKNMVKAMAGGAGHTIEQKLSKKLKPTKYADSKKKKQVKVKKKK